MATFQADLHIHSVLSPCADLLMTPGNIIKKALKKGLDLIAITDHNSAKNVEVAMELARRTSLTVLPGMEVESKEEVHLLCLFDQLENLLAWQQVVYEALPALKNNEEYFGYQLITDRDDQYQKKEERLLVTATDLTVENIVKIVSSKNGLVIPAHIDRPYHSLLANLGFIPQDLNLTLLEVSAHCSPVNFRTTANISAEYCLVCNSDSHYLEEIRPMFALEMNSISIEEIRLAANNENGRKINLKY